MTDQVRYEHLTQEIADTREQINGLTSALGALEAARQDVADKLAEAATTDEELIRWSTSPVGMQRLTEAVFDLHPAIVAASQWRLAKRSTDAVNDVWLMPELDMPYMDKVDEHADALAAALVEFARRFATTPVPVQAHSDRIMWVRVEDMPAGRLPVYLRMVNKNEPHRWSIEFDPETGVALLTDDDTIVRPFAGTLPQVLVQASRKLWDIDH